MNWDLLLPLLVATVVAVTGWVVGHSLNARRDLRNKLLELRINYLLETYRKLETSVTGEVSRDDLGDLNSVISDIQLLCNPEQSSRILALVEQYISGYRVSRGVSIEKLPETQKHDDLKNLITELVEELRSILRQQLGLSPVTKPPIHIKFDSERGVENSTEKR